MKDHFYEMKVYDGDGNLKYIVPPEEVRRRHISYVNRSPNLFSAADSSETRHLNRTQTRVFSCRTCGAVGNSMAGNIKYCSPECRVGNKDSRKDFRRVDV